MHAPLTFPPPGAWRPEHHRDHRRPVGAGPCIDGSARGADAAALLCPDRAVGVGAPDTRTVRLLSVLLLLALPLGVLAGTTASPDAEAVAHAAHHATMGENALKRTQAEFHLPDIRLVREDGKAVSLAEALDNGHPVFVDFIYTTCTAICPVTTATFAALQDKLAAAKEPVNLVSFSIDPEEDTPRRLTEFRRKYGAGPQWHHYTGTVEASGATQRAFGVFTGDKMGHTPVTLFRAAPGRQWVRLDGFATPDELLHEYNAAAAGRSPSP